MATIKDGGPAFPRTREQVSDRTDAADYKHFGEDGMSLRDYFAAKALSGLLSDAKSIAAMRERYAPQVAQHLAEACYSFADAMLDAREK